MTRYYAFYSWAYGSESRREVFDSVEDVEAFYCKAMTPGSDYKDVIVICGDVCEFDPVKVVERWRLRD